MRTYFGTFRARPTAAVAFGARKYSGRGQPEPGQDYPWSSHAYLP